MSLAKIFLNSVAVAAALGSLTFAGCGSDIFGDSELEFGGTCHVAKDQMGSFMAPVTHFPLTALLDSTFSDEERRSILDAVAEWNAVARKIAGHDFFRVNSVTVSNSIRSLNPQDCSEGFSDDASFYMVKVTDLRRWKQLGFSEIIPGATVRCSAKYSLSHQIVLLNPGEKDEPLIDPTQFKSVVVHELGHSLGLDHSCIDAQGRPDYRSCRGLPVDHPYHSAVMFPRLSQSIYSSALSTVAPEIKEIPLENDFTRAQCLYSPE